MYMYSKRGFYHSNNGEISGDVVCGMDDGQTAILTLADGVSSCVHGAEGAKIASLISMEYIREQYDRLHFLPKGWERIMVRRIQERLKSISGDEGNLYEEYSSTLMAIAIDKKRGIIEYCNIGDGLIMSISEKKCPIICMPQGGENGCPVITTIGIEKSIDAGSLRVDSIDSILICSDGTWNMMYTQNIIKPEIKEKLINKNFDGFKEYIKDNDSFDDCSFAIANVRRAA